MSESLYFIAVVPPEDIQHEITNFKHVIAEKFGSKHALNAPPHITLHMPFKWKEKKIQKLLEAIQEINSEFDSFSVQLSGFDFFEPRVVFVKVIENEKLKNLQKLVVDRCRKKLKLDNGNYKGQVFHPHVTIGFRDLKKRMFYEAKEYFGGKDASFRFKIEMVELLRHDGERWKILK
ncbi:MAG: 2'-5' RNA ligase family protein [Cyclobacteriaceae bacterium]